MDGYSCISSEPSTRIMTNDRTDDGALIEYAALITNNDRTWRHGGALIKHVPVLHFASRVLSCFASRFQTCLGR